ncbi:Na+/H+ antiporter NhaA [Pseudomonas sp. NCCP-436]|uniref:Na+/H+ antiporter NhaA n=1 Tax=Pseudomonas sp. NCCP-436 TaxID=2842481 RepID=UPI001C821301|nr:Na+/H+ antiporter NhaA [Pseudomonas sp. NCCP-436]GIZ13700.1 Na(+)/H(+) antiporter NhaA [Pseudomonas sp. NCCP-436]
MNQPVSHKAVPAARRLADKAFASLEKFFHIEAVSGIVLLVAAAVALLWANSPYAESYQHLWHTPLYFGLGDYRLSYSLHFWINDALMTVFFLVVGMEIRREIHDGSLSSLAQVVLPMIAAIGGVALPALFYLTLNGAEQVRNGWAVPTATDIAFAVGVLAILGRSIPPAVRIFLLTLAIIDDIIAVLIIALFYSGGLAPEGFVIAGLGVLLVLGLQRIGVGCAWVYLLPGALLWFGLLKTGAHPTLAGVVLGLMTPVRPVRFEDRPLELAREAVMSLNGHSTPEGFARSVRRLRYAQRELLPPALRVQMALHPWVAYGVMPLFALANAGVALGEVNLADSQGVGVMLGVLLALVAGKPLGIVCASWLLIRFSRCQMPEGLSWRWLWLVGCLGGIGFTMSIFIANLAFPSSELLGAAKLGVLLASFLAALIGLVFGYGLVRRIRQEVA